MGDLAIRRNRGFAVPPRQEEVKTEKTSSSVQSRRAAKTTGLIVSETLRQLMDKAGVNLTQESRKTLLSGEAVLAEVQDHLSRIAELAEEAAGGGEPDRAALQAELERLVEEIDRMVGSVFAGDAPLFLDGETAGAVEEPLPDWLVDGLTRAPPTAEQLLSALGLDRNASGAEILAALAVRPLESNFAAGYLAALYLGAVISGEAAGPQEALEGLRQLLEEVAEGVPIDEAVEKLTDGAFTGLEDFQAQFTGGTAPGLQAFLEGLLLAGPDAGALAQVDTALLNLLAGLEGMNLELLLNLLTAPSEAAPEAAAGAGAAHGAVGDRTAGSAADRGEGLTADRAASGANGADGADAAVGRDAAAGGATSVQWGRVQVAGRDLSGVTFDAASLTVGGTGNVTVQGAGQEIQTIHITGTGTVTLQNVRAATLAVDGGEVHVFSLGKNTVGEIQLKEGASLTLGGGGFLKTGGIRGNASNVLRLINGAVAVLGKDGKSLGALAIPVQLDGPASLAAQASRVTNLQGKALEPFDVVWKALLPGWSGMTAMALDGKRAALMGGGFPDPVRLWMEKGDGSHGSPIHHLFIRGRDASGRTKTRYAYLYWKQQARAFQEIPMYPNPFTVTGGEPIRDWRYDEPTHTLHVLSNRVTAISGGSGRDANQVPFSGRIALADGIGEMELTLCGVVCRVASGRAFHLGRGNRVTLVLRDGTSNCFESGAGCAGISLGDGTSLRIDCGGGGGHPAGTLTATGGEGSAGIGRDGGRNRKCAAPVLVQGGSVAEKRGEITVTGGKAEADGGLWAHAGILMRMGEDAALLPQFNLSAKALRLDRMSVLTREYAQAAQRAVDTDRRWVSQIQAEYNALHNQLEQGGFSRVHEYPGEAEGLVRDTSAASALLKDMDQSALSTQARGGQKAEKIRRLLW